MSLTMLSVVVDCAEPRRQAEFWAGVLAGQLADRWHIDVVAEGPMSDEVERVVALGARLVEVRTDPDDYDNPDTWTVLEDPEGNVFCITSTQTLTGWV